MHTSCSVLLNIYIYTIRCTNDIKNKENKEAVVRRLLQNSSHLFFISYLVARRQILQLWWRNRITHPILTAANYIWSKFTRFRVYSTAPLAQLKAIKNKKIVGQGILSSISGNFSKHLFIRLPTGDSIFIKLLLNWPVLEKINCK